MTALGPYIARAMLLGIFPEAASTGAQRIDLLNLALIGVTVFFIVLIGTLILVYSVKYREESPATRSKRIRGAFALEITWIVVPLILGLLIFAWSAEVYSDVVTPPAGAQSIYIVGKQWMWKIQHPSGRREINELHVPTGTPIKLVMTSQDVIHSFFLPAFRIKQDVLPNRYTQLWFHATVPGEYHLFCAEYCGTDHSGMRGRLVVMKPADFQRWLLSEPAQPIPTEIPAGAAGVPENLRGEPFYRFGCNACHVLGTPVRAPRLDGVFGQEVRLQSDVSIIADEDYLRESILNPNAKIVAGYDAPSLMPSYQGQVSEDDLVRLIEFIKSLRYGWQPAEASPEGTR